MTNPDALCFYFFLEKITVTVNKVTLGLCEMYVINGQSKVLSVHVAIKGSP